MRIEVYKFFVVVIALGIFSPKIITNKDPLTVSLISSVSLMNEASAESSNSQADQINKYRENKYRENPYSSDYRKSSYQHHDGYYQPTPVAPGIYRSVYVGHPAQAPVVVGNCRVVYMGGVRYRDCGNGDLIRY